MHIENRGFGKSKLDGYIIDHSTAAIIYIASYCDPSGIRLKGSMYI